MNVLCVCFDTFRADIVGAGAPLAHVATPTLDDFAAAAVVFDRAFGEGQPTLQMRRSFFTGRRSFPWRFNFDRRGHWHHAPGWHKIPPEHDTIAEILVDRGYLTGLVADTYHMFKPTMNFSRGFCTWDHVRGQESDAWRNGPREAVEPLLERWVRQPIAWGRHATLVQYAHNQRHRRTDDDYQCARVADSACRWLDDNHANGPFFLWVDFFDPHEPWDPPRHYADRYGPAGYDGLDFVMPGAAGPERTAAEAERIKALYYGEVTFVDHCFGRIVDTLDRLKLWDDTVVVVASDHGTELLDHGLFGKGAEHMHPYNTRLNLMVRHPDGPTGRRVDRFVQAHDLAPTICSWLDVPYERFDGRDFWPTVEGATLRDEIVVGWAMFGSDRAGGRASVRCDRWNYAVTVHDDQPGPELYDLAADPLERVNVIDQHPDVAAAKRRSVEALVGKPLPAKLEEIVTRYMPPPAMRMTAARG